VPTASTWKRNRGGRSTRESLAVSSPGYNLRVPPEKPMRDRIARLAAQAPGLQLLVLHGSRGRGDERPDSDWDLAYLGDASFDPDDLLADLVLGLRTDRIDLANLGTAGGLFRYRVARDGQPLFEARDGAFADFWMRAVSFWCDAGPILRAGYEAILAEYG